MLTSEQSELLRTLQRDSVSYFVHQTNPANGLARDKSREGWPASIAATGLALAAYPVGVECGFMTRDDAVQRTLATLRFFANAPHGPESDATGQRGFYYHFLDTESGVADAARSVSGHRPAARGICRRLLGMMRSAQAPRIMKSETANLLHGPFAHSCASRLSIAR